MLRPKRWEKEIVVGMFRYGLPSMASGMTKYFQNQIDTCLLYTSDAADERSSVDLGGRRIIKKKKKII